MSPGPIETPIFGKSGFTQEQIQGFKDYLTAKVALKRIGTSEEVAAAVLFLAADATYVTGAELVVGGGMNDV